MNIHEYQGKELLRRYGVAVLDGYVAKTPEEAEAAAKKLPGPVVVVKSQIHAGGRGAGRFKDDPNGKGGVRVVKPEGAKEAAAAMIGHTLVTKQTGPEGKVVNQVYVEAGCDIKRELYLSLLVDRETSRITIMASTEGGMEIEEVAENHPEKILKVAIDPAAGIQGWHGRKLAFGLSLEGKQVNTFVKFVTAMYNAFTDLDMAIVEINPLVVTGAGEIVALDAKVSFDDNALFRHKDLEALRDDSEMDPKELEAVKNDLNYVALDGEIGCMVNGAGLAMATMDIIKLYGSSPANFLDVGGTANAARVTEAFRIITSDSNVKAILVNIFGGIAKCDMIAEGIVEASKNLSLSVPLVVRLEGTNVELGKKILADSGLAIIPADNLADAAQKVVDAVKKAA
ncbi:ADP-forming succinate--CoA ligase subunit beta [Roseomonas xinghualingensis]|uniref:ADP-forming succinate--CoA ligase subunit beta n=1 Tax=Roseomonas xinghualingensis TaxID=2986475 RepID=UPI0021F1AFD1|nr:ADP-forming succinate--CoA ligase subunit beta [Roseomonas sp. SXEYE001]MCV4207036.1 ADP-forming succinate--CoA ligase subunit beta [Roseomonas sp. SXEYE001]